MDNIKELIEKKISEITKNEDENDCLENGALECVPVEVEGAMRDFKDVGNKFEINVDEMVTQLNIDQKRIFDRITAGISDDNSEVLRLYVSGEGGTGKSFLIKTIRCWIKKYIEKDTAVTAPTGIAAFNIDGLTIHRLFQLPVEHGRTAKYTQLSDVVLRIIREELKNVVLIIIDEVSIISNITLMYIHLRLTAIFNTMDCDNGWFGKKHILFFGDLLQLPPVHEDPPFIELSKLKIEKYIGAMGKIMLTLFGIPVIFHIVSNDFPISQSGILGNNFFKQTSSKIDYAQGHLDVSGINIPFLSPEAIIVARRSESLFYVKIENPKLKVGYIPRLKVAHGIYLEDTIVENVAGKTYLNVISTLNEEAEVNVPTLRLKPLGELLDDHDSKIEALNSPEKPMNKKKEETTYGTFIHCNDTLPASVTNGLAGRSTARFSRLGAYGIPKLPHPCLGPTVGPPHHAPTR
ncbi:uncharacterized protein LOC115234769, partial [Formica exsecta]|uniref:uncharacterized protein LOC115234769 n=1 Tax=Formica exsecta TaxID=72781 RepID=UPI001142DD42